MEPTDEVRLPKIIVPYSKTCVEDQCQDIVVYLRPETNGIHVESTLLRVLREPEKKDRLKLVYLANLPGSFIVQKRIVENHYSTRVHFAAQGRNGFTPTMISQFERFFGIPFAQARILGAFEALQQLKISPEQLFNIWVPVYDILEINGQLIKRVEPDLFIVNYDIPALLHKNNNNTDVAVMVFRTAMSYQEFKPLVEDMRQALISNGILDPYKPESRVFHYSKGPFEQLLDGLGYVFLDTEHQATLDDLHFGLYLKDKGLSEAEIRQVLDNPIMEFTVPGGTVLEANLYTFTIFDSYEMAYEKLKARIVRNHEKIDVDDDGPSGLGQQPER